jgi:hypothetical protein
VDRRGRPMGDAGITEVASTDSRDSRVGMFSKKGRPVLEIHPEGRGGRRPARIRQRKRVGSGWKSEGAIVPFEVKGQHNPCRGKGPYFVHASEGRRIRGLFVPSLGLTLSGPACGCSNRSRRFRAMSLTTPAAIRTLQRKLYAKAKQKRRMPWREEHRKAVCGRTACTV